MIRRIGLPIAVFSRGGRLGVEPFYSKSVFSG